MYSAKQIPAPFLGTPRKQGTIPTPTTPTAKEETTLPPTERGNASAPLAALVLLQLFSK